MMLPAFILVREGSQRLKQKWSLLWRNGTLVENAVRQALRCKYVDQVFVCSDGDAVLRTVEKRFGFQSREPHLHTSDGLNRVETIKRPKVDATQPSLGGLRWCMEQQHLQASFCLLIQATFPFLHARDLDRLVEAWDGGNGLYLGKPDEPNVPAGAAWLVHPTRGYDQRGVSVTTPCVDVDVRADYDRAVEIAREQR